MSSEVQRRIEISGTATEQKLVRAYYAFRGSDDVEVIATDQFLNKSRAAYNAPWLTREIVQNFVDNNASHLGTLDGVRFTREDLTDGTKRFRVEGDWIFLDPTGLGALHSDKPKGRNSAGGNGIALKQTAIRFLRDFGVTKFEIEGEGWTWNYLLVKASDVNSELEASQLPHRIKNDWLVGELRESTNTGRNAYVIETQSPELIKALEQFPALGVSSENPYLQGIDYRNKYGAIKWLPKGERGRIFINGQVMGYEKKGDPSSENYWIGPESLTVQIDDIHYEMSIDRPPISSFDLSSYMSDMVIRGMSKEDLLEQIKRSEYLWAGHFSENDWEKEGALVLVRELLGSVPYKGLTREERAGWIKYFAEKRYLSYDGTLNEEKMNKLKEEGYTLCPSYFEKLGMPTASSLFKPVEKEPTYEEKKSKLVIKKKKAAAELEAVEMEIKALDEEEKRKHGISTVPEITPIIEPPDVINQPIPRYETPVRGQRNIPWRRIFGASAAVLTAGIAINIIRQGNGETVPVATPRPAAAAASLPPRTAEVRSATPTRTSSPAETLTPEQKKALEDLNLAIQQNTQPPKVEKSITEKYQDWKNSGDFYGQLGDNARYTQGRNFNELIQEQYQELVRFSGTDAKAEPPKNNDEFRKQAEAVINNNRPPEDVIRNFEVTNNPTQNQLAQLGLLRLYTQETTGLAIPNDLFIYKGDGASGINIDRKAIGLHENSLKVRFIESLRIFIHEVSHNYSQSNGHDDKFHDAMESTLMKIIDKTTQIANKFEKGQTLTAEEKVILDIQAQWEILKGK